MLSKPEAIVAIAEALAGRHLPMVIDPVMVAKGGHKLLDEDAHRVLVARLIPLASLLTPNIPEAEALTGLVIAGPEDMVAAGRALLALGPKAVLVKGGHLPGDNLVDVLVGPDEVLTFEGERLHTTSTHGTGCTTASAIATGLAQGLPLVQAIRRARAYVRAAIASAPGFGRGHGPLNHGHTVRPFEV